MNSNPNRFSHPRNELFEPLDEFIKRNNKLYGEESNLKEKIWYRGQNNSSYSLIPSVYRNIDSTQNENYTEKAKSNLSDIKNNLVTKLSGESISNGDPKIFSQILSYDDWSFLFFMQHYGFTSPFLDWTNTFEPARLFALNNLSSDDTARVWFLNPRLLNKIYNGKEGITNPSSFQNPLELIDGKNTFTAMSNKVIDLPVQRTEYQETALGMLRLKEQNGNFTFHQSSEDLYTSIKEKMKKNNFSFTINDVISYMDIEPKSVELFKNSPPPDLDSGISYEDLFPERYITKYAEFIEKLATDQKK